MQPVPRHHGASWNINPTKQDLITDLKNFSPTVEPKLKFSFDIIQFYWVVVLIIFTANRENYLEKINIEFFPKSKNHTVHFSAKVKIIFQHFKMVSHTKLLFDFLYLLNLSFYA